jgi:drug/metabolite transporter (DMT)-like permease
MVYIIAAMIMWSFLGVIVKSTAIDVDELIFFSASISSIILLSYIFIRDYKMLCVNSSLLISIYLIAVIGLLNNFTFYYAFKNTTVALAVLTHYTAPFFVMILAAIFLREKITFKVLLSILSATIGMYLILDLSFEALLRQISERDSHALGVLSGLASGLFYAILVIIFKKILHKIDILPLTALQNSFVAITLIPFFDMPQNLPSVLPTLLVLGIVQSTIAPLIYLKGIRQVRANTAAILGYIEPLSAILLGIIILGESIGLSTVIGGLLILFSGLVCSLNQKTGH